MNWLEYVQKNWKHFVFCYMRTKLPVNRSWGKPVIRKPRLDGNKLWIPASTINDAGYIDLDKHEVVYNQDVTEFGKIGIDLLFQELKHINSITYN